MKQCALLIIILLSSCGLGTIPDKDLSKSNIAYIELSFPNSKNPALPIRLNSKQSDVLDTILRERKKALADPTNCYELFIQLKNSSVHYRTDGINFQGYDSSTDLPFSFSTKRNILTDVFKLSNIEHCK
jgi:hypothetical protein